MQPSANPRYYYLDWIKVLCISLLIPYHAAMIFGPANFGIKNDTTNAGYNIFNEMIGMWYFSLLAFISGAATLFSLRTRTNRQYVWSRVTRLLIPLLFGMLIIIPPQVYVERLQKQQITPGYPAFYSHLFDGVYPAGNLNWAQLWYIAYLFVLSLLLFPICVYLKRRPHLLQEGFRYMPKAPYILILCALPLMLIEYFLRAYFPFGNQNLVSDWANVLHLSVLFLYGYIIMRSAYLQEAMLRCRKLALFLALTGALLYYIPYIAGIFSPYQQPANILRWLDTWRGFNAWCWVLAIVGYAHYYLNTNNTALQYTSKVFLSIYILHQTILLCVAYFVVKWNMASFGKFLILTVLSYILSLLIYQFVILRIRFIRFLFGG